MLCISPAQRWTCTVALLRLVKGGERLPLSSCLFGCCVWRDGIGIGINDDDDSEDDDRETQNEPALICFPIVSDYTWTVGRITSVRNLPLIKRNLFRDWT